jgi:hypothetical protein
MPEVLVKKPGVAELGNVRGRLPGARRAHENRRAVAVKALR